GSGSRRRGRSCPTTSGSPNRTSASGISTESSQGPSSGRSSAVRSGSSQMADETERHLRERLNRLRGLPLLRGSRLSGEMERLQKQLDRIQAERAAPSDDEIWRSVEL